MKNVAVLKSVTRRLAEANGHKFSRWQRTDYFRKDKSEWKAQCTECDMAIFVAHFGNGPDIIGQAKRQKCCGVKNGYLVLPWKVERMGPMEPNNCSLHQDCTYVYTVVHVDDPRMGNQSGQTVIADCPSKRCADQIVKEHNAAIKARK